jgi:hypothetical protein
MKQVQDAQQPPFKIKLAPPSEGEVVKFAVWRTDFYICTGISFAKRVGKPVEDFVSFVGETHSWEDMRGQGLEPPVQLLYFAIKSYDGGEFEIISEAENCVTMKSNRPYARFFKNNSMLDVSLEEFELCLWQHISIMAKRINLDFTYRIEGNHVFLTLSK